MHDRTTAAVIPLPHPSSSPPQSYLLLPVASTQLAALWTAGSSSSPGELQIFESLFVFGTSPLEHDIACRLLLRPPFGGGHQMRRVFIVGSLICWPMHGGCRQCSQK